VGAGAGEPIGDERPLRLRGFPGGAACEGNRVRGQFQLDAFGEALSLHAAAARHGLLGEDDWRAAEVAVSAIAERWQEPDAGIWELDGRHWAHSRLACVSGLRAIAEAAAAWGPGAGAAGGYGGQAAARWSSLADAIAASLKDCVHPSGRWQRAPDDERLDAALLLPVIRGGAGRDDPRTRAEVGGVGGVGGPGAGVEPDLAVDRRGEITLQACVLNDAARHAARHGDLPFPHVNRL